MESGYRFFQQRAWPLGAVSGLSLIHICYLGNLRWTSLGYPALYPGFESEPESMEWVSQYADANMVKTDFFEARCV